MINTIFLYLDPGSGSYLIQAIIAAVLGAAFYFKKLLVESESLFLQTEKER